MRKRMERIKKEEEREEKQGLLVDHKSRNLNRISARWRLF